MQANKNSSKKSSSASDFNLTILNKVKKGQGNFPNPTLVPAIHQSKLSLLSVCLGQKVYFNEIRTGTVEDKQSHGCCNRVHGKTRNRRRQESEERKSISKRKEDIVVPPSLQSEEDMSPLPMVDKFEKAPVYLLLRMVHLSEKMRDEHKHLMVCGNFEGFDIVPEDMVIAVKLKKKKNKNINNSVRKPVVQELSAQQKNLSILQEDKHGAAAFSVYGLQDARFVTAASSQGLTVSKNASAVAVISPKMEHDMVYMLITRVRAPSQLVFLGLELNSFLTRKPQPHLALYLQRFDQNELYFFSDLKTSYEKLLLWWFGFD